MAGTVTARRGPGTRQRARVGSLLVSATGTCGAAGVVALHGGAGLPIAVFAVSQTWAAAELACHWLMRWQLFQIQKRILLAALADPSNQDLRTLLVDVGSTHQFDLSDRLPLRTELTKAAHTVRMPRSQRNQPGTVRRRESA